MAGYAHEAQDVIDKSEPLDPPLPSPSASSSHEEEREEEREEESAQHDLEKGDVPPADNAVDGRPQVSRTISTQSKPLSLRKVPVAQRSGWLGRLSLLYEAEEPKSYPRGIKWFITFEIALAAVAAPMGSSIILPALNDITSTFGTSHTVANLSVAFYMLSMSLFPLWWSAMSEATGRRAVYIASFALFIVWNVLAAVSSSISMFIVMRILSGGSSAAVQAVGAGTVADIWEVKERGRAMGIFYLGPLCGPLLSPIIGGGLTDGFGWRSTQWFQMIYGGMTLLLIILGLPETHKTSNIVAAAEAQSAEKPSNGAITPRRTASPGASLSRSSTRQSVKLKSRKYAALLDRIFIEPLSIAKYLRFPAVALVVYYASIAFGSLYFLNISVEKTFSAPPYNFSVIIIGCLYIFNSAGYIIASIFGGRWVDYIMHRRAYAAGRINSQTNKPIFRPEDRMGENVWVAAFLMPGCLLWYGWAAQEGVHWAVPMVANFFFGVGSMLLFAAATTMLTEFMPKKASSGVALNNFVRNVFSFAGTLLAEPLIDAIGNGALFSILAGIAMASCFVIVLMRRYGDKWREDMDRRMD
ncbi:MAG: hypothetical protein Q9162_004428 [Coniocarpon cinnabarinum]